MKILKCPVCGTKEPEQNGNYFYCSSCNTTFTDNDIKDIELILDKIDTAKQELMYNARKKLVPVFGKPAGKAIKLKKSDETMIIAPTTLEGHKGIYAVIPNSKRLGGFIPESSYVFVDANAIPNVGDLAVCINSDFDKLSSEDVVNAQIVVVRQDAHGKIFGHVSNPDEKVSGKTMHKVVMIVMQ